MNEDYSNNNFEFCGIVQDELKGFEYINNRKREKYVVIFNVKLIDMMNTPIRVIAFNDYARKLEATLKPQYKAQFWTSACMFQGEVYFIVRRVLLMEIPE